MATTWPHSPPGANAASARAASAATPLSLWTVIEAMQRRLEREGLDAAVVDAAVTQGIAALLRDDETVERPMSFLTACAVGES